MQLPLSTPILGLHFAVKIMRSMIVSAHCTVSMSKI